MADKPILFSAPMIKALIAGRKSQTRRVLNPQPNMLNGGKPLNDGRGSYSIDGGWKRIPISAGDRLWVREAHHRTNDSETSHLVGYDSADDPDHRESYSREIEGVGKVWFFAHSLGGWGGRLSRNYPSIHMPRWASRLTLIVQSVKVERLQDISEEDAIAEGIEPFTDFRPYGHWKRYRDGGWNSYVDNPIGSYASLWTEINGAGSWEKNPWVSVTSFKTINQNIDQIGGAT